jgi:hypothetical protein
MVGRKTARRVWYELGGRTLLLADTIRKTAERKFLHRQDSLSRTIVSTPEGYIQQQTSLKTQLDKELATADRLANFAHYYTYFGLNTNRINFLPVRNRQHTPLYFNSASVVKAGEFLGRSISAINPSNGKLGQYTELYADYIGWARAAVGFTVVNSKNSPGTPTAENQQDESIQRLAIGGGNMLFVVAFPLASFHTDDDHFAVKMHLQPRIAADLPQQGQASNDFAYHSELGVELFGYYTGFNSIISPYAGIKAGRNWGNILFYQNLGRSSTSGFTLVQVDFGLSLGQAVQIGAKYSTGSGFIRDTFPLSIAVALIPKALTK